MYWKKIGTKLANEDVAGTEHELNLALDSYHKRRKPDIKTFFKVIDESEKNDDTRKISAISKKLQPLGLYTPFKDISELKDNVSKILQAEVMNLIRKQGQVMPEIHKYIEISDTNEFISNFSSNNKLVLNKGYYDMLDFERENTDNIFKEEVFDGNQLVVSNISNVTVVGDNSTLLVNVYEEIKEFVCIYGKIEESVFDDGQIYINVITSRFENISQIESFIEGYDNLATACG